MIVSKMVALIHRRNPKYTPTEILEMINEVHQRCVEQELDAFLYKDPTTGMPPFLETFDSVYVYNCPENCRKTSKIASLCSESGYQRNTYRQSEEVFEWCGRRFFKISGIDQACAIPDNDQLATVTFGGLNNPGNTTSTYYHFYWIKANQIESLSDQLQIPPITHSYNFIDAVCDLIATEDYGKGQDIIKQLVVNVAKSFSSAANGRTGKIIPNRLYNDY
jgi:hypothetical protein